MQIKNIEAQVKAALAADNAERGEALDILLCHLLSTFGGLSPRVTDGLVLLREELAPQVYFGVAKVFMISDQSIEPAIFELALTPDFAFTSGCVRFGLADGQLPRGINSRSKLETVMLAFPHEAIAFIPWAFTFERTASEWVRRGS